MNSKRKIFEKLCVEIPHVADYEYPVKWTKEEITVQARSWGESEEDFMDVLFELERAGFAKIIQRNWVDAKDEETVALLEIIPHSYIYPF